MLGPDWEKAGENIIIYCKHRYVIFKRSEFDRICKWFDWNGSLCSGRCYASKEDFVREYKGVCPAVMKRSLFEVPRKFL